jgi:hypothetical protein
MGYKRQERINQQNGNNLLMERDQLSQRKEKKRKSSSEEFQLFFFPARPAGMGLYHFGSSVPAFHGLFHGFAL